MGIWKDYLNKIQFVFVAQNLYFLVCFACSKASCCLPPPNLLLISHAEEVHFVKMAAQGKNDAQARSKLHHWRILRQRRSFGATTHAPPADPLVGYGVAAAVQIIVGTPLHTLKTFQSVMASVQRTWIVLLLPYGRFHILKKTNPKVRSICL